MGAIMHVYPVTETWLRFIEYFSISIYQYYTGTYGIGQVDILRALSTEPQFSTTNTCSREKFYGDSVDLYCH